MVLRKRFALRACLVATVIVLGLAQAVSADGGQTLDSFDVDQAVLVYDSYSGSPNPFSSPQYDTVNGGSIIGTERDLVVTQTSGDLTLLAAASGGQFSHNPGLDVSGCSVLTWDGDDGDGEGSAALTEALTTSGLGGIDLTMNSANSFGIGVVLAAGGTLTVTAYDTTGNSGSSSVEITTTIAAAEVLEFPFSDFGSVTLTSVGAIILEICSSGDVITLDYFETGYYPEPTAVKQLSLNGAGNSIQILAGTVVAAGALVVARAKTKREN